MFYLNFYQFQENNASKLVLLLLIYRINFENGGWHIADGINNKSSLNGTWFSIGNSKGNEEEQLEEIIDGSSIKIH